MRLILKSICRSIWERKTYTLLVISSIMISSAMFFASISISGTLIKLQTDNWRSSFGYSDIIIQAGSGSPSGYFYESGALKYSANMEYCVGQVSGYAVYKHDSAEKIQVSLRGIDLEGLQQVTPVSLQADKGLQPFKGRKALISKAAAQKYNLAAGDCITLDINGGKSKFTIAGIAENTGPFANEGRSIYAVVPRDAMCSLYNVRGRVDMIYIKLKHPELKSRLLVKLMKEYGRQTVREPFSEQETRRQTDSIAAPIILVTLILSFMSIYIIYTTFKVIVVERLPVIAAFHSLGATKTVSEAVLLTESLLYGAIGGASGCCTGILLLYAMSVIMNPQAAAKGITALQFSPLQLAAAFALAIVLSLAGSLSPVLKASGASIKSLIGNISNEKYLRSKKKRIAAVTAIICAIAVPHLLSGDAAKWLDAACVLILLYGVVNSIPDIIKVLSYMLKPAYGQLFGNIGPLALKNLQENKNLLSNVSLLVIGISTLFMISTINYGESMQITECFSRCLYDVRMEVSGATKSTLSLIRSTDGVKDAYAGYISAGIAVEGYDEPIWHFEGINTDSFTSYFKLRYSPESNTIMKELDSGRNILLTTTLKDKYKLSLNDDITLILRKPGGAKVRRQYRVTGFFENLYPGMWSYALVSERYYRLDIDHGSYGQIYIKSSGNIENTVGSLQSVFGRRKPVIGTIAAQKQEVVESNRQLFLILEGFSIMALAAGASGITNNLIIGLLQRKRTFAVLRSIGMSRRQNTALILLESLTGGIIGGAAGVGTGFVITFFIVPQIMKALKIETHIYYSGLIFATCFALAFIITAAASLIPVSRLRKLNTIEALKYE